MGCDYPALAMRVFGTPEATLSPLSLELVYAFFEPTDFFGLLFELADKVGDGYILLGGEILSLTHITLASN